MDITITSAEAGKTIYTLTRQDMGFSSAMLKKLKFSEGGILVNGEFVTVRYILKEGDVLSVKVIDIDRASGKIRLSRKAALADEE